MVTKLNKQNKTNLVTHAHRGRVKLGLENTRAPLQTVGVFVCMCVLEGKRANVSTKRSSEG